MADVARPAPAELARRRRQTAAFLDLARIIRSLDRTVDGHFAHQGLDDITPAQANALMVLFEARSPLTARRLAESLSLSEVTVGRFLRALENQGWVARVRDPNDSRAILVSPTAKARAKLPTFIQVTNALMDQAFGDMAPGPMSDLLDGIRHMRENLDPPKNSP
jgi:DNA-binding MarR family transcriptional regulator